MGRCIALVEEGKRPVLDPWTHSNLPATTTSKAAARDAADHRRGCGNVRGCTLASEGYLWGWRACRHLCTSRSSSPVMEKTTTGSVRLELCGCCAGSALGLCACANREGRALASVVRKGPNKGAKGTSFRSLPWQVMVAVAPVREGRRLQRMERSRKNGRRSGASPWVCR